MATLTEVKAKLAKYEAAEDAVLDNQSYTVNGTTYTRADLQAIQRRIVQLENKVAVLSGAGFGTQQVVFGGRR